MPSVSGALTLLGSQLDSSGAGQTVAVDVTQGSQLAEFASGLTPVTFGVDNTDQIQAIWNEIGNQVAIYHPAAPIGVPYQLSATLVVDQHKGWGIELLGASNMNQYPTGGAGSVGTWFQFDNLSHGIQILPPAISGNDTPGCILDGFIIMQANTSNAGSGIQNQGWYSTISNCRIGGSGNSGLSTTDNWQCGYEEHGSLGGSFTDSLIGVGSHGGPALAGLWVADRGISQRYYRNVAVALDISTNPANGVAPIVVDGGNFIVFDMCPPKCGGSTWGVGFYVEGLSSVMTIKNTDFEDVHVAGSGGAGVITDNQLSPLAQARGYPTGFGPAVSQLYLEKNQLQTFLAQDTGGRGFSIDTLISRGNIQTSGVGSVADLFQALNLVKYWSTTRDIGNPNLTDGTTPSVSQQKWP